MKIETIEDIREIESVPLRERLAARSTYEMILRGARGREEHTALRFFPSGERFQQTVDITYGQLLGRIHQTANMLLRLGIGAGDVLTLLLPNLPQTHFALWGGQAAGIVNPVNPSLGARAIAQIMNAAQSKVLVALGRQPGSDIWEKALRARGKVPSLKAVLRVGGGDSGEEGVYDFDEMADACDPGRLQGGREISPDDIAAIFHTGGTTGVPKLARHTHRNEVYNAWAIGVAGGASEGDTYLCGLPLFHVNAVIVTGLTPFSVGGGVVLLSPRGYRDPQVIERFFEIVEHFQPSGFSAVPTVYSRLLSVPHEGRDLSSLRYALCGAAPMPPAVFRAFEEKTGLRILEGYGLTEATCASAANPKDGERRIGSIGLRLPYQDMKVFQPGSSQGGIRECEPGQPGIVAVRGPNVFAGYVRESDDEGVWLGDGWLNTGDLGRQDEDGYFWLTGRQKDVIIRSGHNIDPAPIEEALLSHPAVALAAAVGRPDPDAGELPVAFVSLEPGADASQPELMELCRERIEERAARPKRVQILPEIPVTPVGKVYKPGLRLLAAQAAFKDALEEQLGRVRRWNVKGRQDPERGMVMKVEVEAAQEERPLIQDMVARAVSGFAIPCDLVWK